MHYGMLKFERIPEIGFAHHCYSDNYSVKYSKKNKSFEIVYVSAGGITVELFGEKQYAEAGSIIVVFRQLPLVLSCEENMLQSHCTVQAETEFDLELIDDIEKAQRTGKLLLPLVTEPCAETEEIRKELYSIVSAIGMSREENDFLCSIRLLGIMNKIDNIARKRGFSKKKSSADINRKVRKYVVDNIDKQISLNDVAEYIHKTPNYINYAFKKETGTTIKQYINAEKISRISQRLQGKSMSFKTACESVAINDISYGYRLFKKYTGVTPKSFLLGDKIYK